MRRRAAQISAGPSQRISYRVDKRIPQVVERWILVKISTQIPTGVLKVVSNTFSTVVVWTV